MNHVQFVAIFGMLVALAYISSAERPVWIGEKWDCCANPVIESAGVVSRSKLCWNLEDDAPKTYESCGFDHALVALAAHQRWMSGDKK